MSFNQDTHNYENKSLDDKEKEKDPSSSFTIISSDNISLFGKPNAIVRPLRRLDSTDKIPTIENQIVTGQSLSKPKNIEPRTVNKLPAKAKENQRPPYKYKTTKNTTLPPIHNGRPLFITTVPKGVFLSPTRDYMPAKRRCYAYMSQPRIMNTNGADSKCQEPIFERLSTYAKIATGVVRIRYGKSRYSQPVQNEMFDKRIFRGRNFATQQSTNSDINDDTSTREEEAARRNLIRRKTLAQRTKRGIFETPPAPSRTIKYEPTATGRLIEGIFIGALQIDAGCQTEHFITQQTSNTIDHYTDLKKGEIVTFDSYLQSILDNLVERTVKQGFIEALHEEDMAEIKLQQQKYLTESKLLGFQELLEKERHNSKSQEKRASAKNSSAAKLLQGHIAKRLPEVLQNIPQLTEATNRADLEKELSKWLSMEVAEEVGQMIDSKDLLEEIVEEILRSRAEVYMSTDSVISSDEEGSIDETDEASGEIDESVYLHSA